MIYLPKMIVFNVMILFSFFYLSSSTCDVENIYITEIVSVRNPTCDENHHNYYNYYHRCEDPEYKFISTEKRVISNSTISCIQLSAIPRIENINFNIISEDQTHEQNYKTYLVIKESVIPLIPPSQFTNFSSLNGLDMSNNSVRTIVPGAFVGLTNLSSLNLNRNNISEILSGTYSSCVSLKLLDLSYNEIENIAEHAFTGTENLETLILQRNNIKTLPKDFMIHHQQLRHLDLSLNPVRIVSLPIDNLRILLLNQTNLNEIVLLPNITLFELNVSCSALHSMNFDFSVVKLDISRNPFSFNTTINTKLNHSALDDVRNLSKELVYFDLSFNSIAILNETTFGGFGHLISLFLHHNNITKIPTKLFHDLSNLETLDLSYNRLTNFSYGTFNSLVNLKKLMLNNNQLKSFQEHVLSSLKNLMYLNADNNQIESLAYYNLYMNNLKILSINNNKFPCDNLVKLYHSLERIEVNILPGTTYDEDNFHGIKCTNGTNDGNKVINNILENNSSTQLNSEMEKTKLIEFLNNEFENSSFYKYFDREYVNSDFFKYLQNYKISTLIKYLNESKVEKIISNVNPDPPSDNSKIIDRILVIDSVLLSLIFVTLVLIGSIYFKYVYKNSPKPNVSDLELI